MPFSDVDFRRFTLFGNAESDAENGLVGVVADHRPSHLIGRGDRVGGDGISAAYLR
jgi:hypothetical protein